jgi:hypothetical protein
MRGSDELTGSLFSYVDLGDRVPAKHPLRVTRCIVNDVQAALDSEFAKIYIDSGRRSIPPERVLRALLLQAFYTIRSETQLMEQLVKSPNRMQLSNATVAPPRRDASLTLQWTLPKGQIFLAIEQRWISLAHDYGSGSQD